MVVGSVAPSAEANYPDRANRERELTTLQARVAYVKDIEQSLGQTRRFVAHRDLTMPADSRTKSAVGQRVTQLWHELQEIVRYAEAELEECRAYLADELTEEEVERRRALRQFWQSKGRPAL